MTPGDARISPTWDTCGIRTPRFRLKTTGHGSGHVDGAWWPHSDDFTEELPGLIAALSIRLGAVSCVLFNHRITRDTARERWESQCGSELTEAGADPQPPASSYTPLNSRSSSAN